jgi:tetratricopeptide (TPR) repeat protein
MKDFDADDGGELADELEFLFDSAARRILRDESPVGFMEWFRLSAPQIAPTFFKNLPKDAVFLRGFLMQFSRLIWNRTPLPGNHYRPRPLPTPERNQPCLCGSGKKYKHCCQAVEGLEQGLPEFSMLLHVLDIIPAKQLTVLPYSHMNLDELAYVAEVWISRGRAKEAAKLLEGLFVDIDKLDERAELAFERLLDCYDRLGNPLKKKRLLERGMAAPNKFLRVSAMQRQCCILADRGEYGAAWPLFQQVQRLLPNDPSLSHLEIVMLMNLGEQARAKERAAFWIARLSKDRTGDHTQLIAFLSQAVNDMNGSVLNIVQQDRPYLERFTRLVSHLPQPACHYTLKPMTDSAGPLQPDLQLLPLHSEWRAYAEDLSDHQPAINWYGRLDWLDWIEKTPLAWQSLDVLHDLVQALKDTEPRITGMEEKNVLPLLQHAEALLHLAIKQHRAEGLKLEWGWMENRPALRLVAELAYFHAAHDRLDKAIDLMAWLVDTLNPNDNQGLRDDLIHHYLRASRIEAALDLAARYPDDMAVMQYGHILARYMAGHVDEAAALLKQTHARYPEVGKMLANPSPRRPALNPGYTTVGGKDEAWYYREDNLDVWEQSGGLAWLGQMLQKKPGKNP